MSISSLIAARNTTAQFTSRTYSGNTSTTGRQLFTEANLGSAIPCWIQDLTSAVRRDYSVREIVTRQVLFAASNPGVSESDYVTVSGVAYKITGIENQAGLNRLWAFGIERIA